MGDDIMSSFQGIGGRLSAVVSEYSQTVANWPIHVQVIAGAVVVALLVVISRTIRDHFRHA
jgi:hypothetical protein